MSTERPPRLTFEDSCRLLQRCGHLDGGPVPALPAQRPESGDESPHGVRFFRTWVGNGQPIGLQPLNPEDAGSPAPFRNLDNLTLTRAFFGRSEISSISFQNTDLSESTLCWNDFIEVNFTGADMSNSDLRASLYKAVLFVRADLRNADLRRSTFKQCDFTGADMRGAKLTREQGVKLPLTEDQKRAIDWQEDDGDEPDGG